MDELPPVWRSGLKSFSRTLLLVSSIVLVPTALTGCGIVAVEGASVVMSDKAVSDHIVSWVSGKNCSVVRTEKGLTYCVEDELKITPKVFCYKTLGSVSCYNQPDPRRSPDELMGQNDHNLGD